MNNLKGVALALGAVFTAACLIPSQATADPSPGLQQFNAQRCDYV